MRMIEAACGERTLGVLLTSAEAVRLHIYLWCHLPLPLLLSAWAQPWLRIPAWSVWHCPASANDFVYFKLRQWARFLTRITITWVTPRSALYKQSARFTSHVSFSQQPMGWVTLSYSSSGGWACSEGWSVYVRVPTGPPVSLCVANHCVVLRKRPSSPGLGGAEVTFTFIFRSRTSVTSTLSMGPASRLFWTNTTPRNLRWAVQRGRGRACGAWLGLGVVWFPFRLILLRGSY